MNLCESLSIRLFVAEQGLPSGDVPDRTGITSELQRYTHTKMRVCDDECFDVSSQSRKPMKSVLDERGITTGGK
jgi:hypothetical protein